MDEPHRTYVCVPRWLVHVSRLPSATSRTFVFHRSRPFEQVEQELTRNNHGTGLGLALTKSLTEMHGGKLAIQSEVGRGTIVTVTLPRTFGGQRDLEATAAE